jgi:hypothetical protein
MSKCGSNLLFVYFILFFQNFSFLFDRLEQSQPTNESESDTTSSPPRAIDSEEDLSSVGSDSNDDNGSHAISMKQ